MSYQVIARKWRPQRFDDVVGQRGVTQTLRNAIAMDRVAQAFVFAGPRGVGKTTTARILARALNCVSGPTADPCGECDACLEIAAGRDIDVLEIDAATHTQVENVREVIIAGLSITPVRDRYKVFIIDEVHQLSSSSFNALLKSIEEPPPHVVFIMATTLLNKIPDTILSRSQVFEFRTIGTAEINRQLRAIIASEGVAIDDAGLALIARSAAGSMRDAQSALDQVIAFAGESASAEEVSTVLGLVGRDAVFEVAETVADETAPRVFELAGRFVEAGYDLRLVCRELSRLVRDMLVLKVDPARLEDPDIAADAERERLQALTARFSREDLLRGFDVLTRAESEIRSAAQPRYHFEVAMLRWMHLRTLVPLTELLAGLERQPAPAARPRQTPVSAAPSRQAPAAAPQTGAAPGVPPARHAPRAAPPPPPVAPPSAPSPSPAAAAPARPEDPQSAFLAELQRTKKFFYGTVVSQAQQIAVDASTITFTFTAGQQTLARQVETSRAWLEALAKKTMGRQMKVAVRKASAPAPTPEPPATTGASAAPAMDLLSQAMEDPGVQAMLEVLPAEIKDVEEI